jgi:lactoylglutathione lyase
MTQSMFPILTTTDLGRSLAFYRDLLGGVVGYQFPPEGDPDFVSLDLGDSHLGIGRDPAATEATGPQRFSLWVYVDSCDETVEALRAGGATVTGEPTDEPWGERVARALDPDGNTIVIGQAAPAGDG